jgi:hypothetical protein
MPRNSSSAAVQETTQETAKVSEVRGEEVAKSQVYVSQTIDQDSRKSLYKLLDRMLDHKIQESDSIATTDETNKYLVKDLEKKEDKLKFTIKLSGATSKKKLEEKSYYIDKDGSIFENKASLFKTLSPLGEESDNAVLSPLQLVSNQLTRLTPSIEKKIEDEYSKEFKEVYSKLKVATESGVTKTGERNTRDKKGSYIIENLELNGGKIEYDVTFAKVDGVASPKNYSYKIDADGKCERREKDSTEVYKKMEFAESQEEISRIKLLQKSIDQAISSMTPTHSINSKFDDKKGKELYKLLSKRQGEDYDKNDGIVLGKENYRIKVLKKDKEDSKGKDFIELEIVKGFESRSSECIIRIGKDGEIWKGGEVSQDSRKKDLHALVDEGHRGILAEISDVMKAREAGDKNSSVAASKISAAPATASANDPKTATVSTPAKDSKSGVSATNFARDALDSMKGIAKVDMKKNMAIINKAAGYGAMAGVSVAAAASWPLLAVPYIGAPLFAVSVAFGAAAGAVVSAVTASALGSVALGAKAFSNLLKKTPARFREPEKQQDASAIAPTVAKSGPDNAPAVDKDASAVAVQAATAKLVEKGHFQSVKEDRVALDPTAQIAPGVAQGDTANTALKITIARPAAKQASSAPGATPIVPPAASLAPQKELNTRASAKATGDPRAAAMEEVKVIVDSVRENLSGGEAVKDGKPSAGQGATMKQPTTEQIAR